MKVVILAAGAGARFRPLSEVVPKPLLLLGRKPLIHHALDEAASAGFESAVIVIGPQQQLIRRYFELEGLPSQIANRLNLSFAEQPMPLGSGNAVLCAERAVGGQECAVLLPDDVVAGSDHWLDLFRAHEEAGAATLCVRAVPPEDSVRFGIAVCEPNGDSLRVLRCVEKPPVGSEPSNLAIFGRYIVTAEVFAALHSSPAGAHGEFQLTDGFAAITGRRPGVAAVEFKGEIFDCGTPEEYARSVARYPTSG